MERTRIGRRFMQTYEKEDGSLFRGLLGKPNIGQSNSETFRMPRLVLLTPPEDGVSPGEVFIGKGGTKMIILENADEESFGLTQNCFYVVSFNSVVSCERTVLKEDKVTMMVTEESLEDLGQFECAMNYEKYVSSSLKVPEPMYQIVTNKDLKLNDVINGIYIVKKVQKLLGVTVAYVQ